MTSLQITVINNIGSVVLGVVACTHACLAISRKQSHRYSVAIHGSQHIRASADFSCVIHFRNKLIQQGFCCTLPQKAAGSKIGSCHSTNLPYILR